MDTQVTTDAAELKGRHRPVDFDRLIAKRIRVRRQSLGMTQQELADAIGVTYQQAYKYERGVNRLTAARLQMIADALGTTVGMLFRGQGAEKAEDESVVRFVSAYRRLPADQRELVRALTHSLLRSAE